MTVVIGVLALQGAFIEHVRHVEKCIVENRDFYEKKLSVITVKDKNQLAQCDALIIPGGESTAMSLIAERTGFYEDLYAFVHNPSKVTWGTCAGMIYISQQLSNEAKLVKKSWKLLINGTNCIDMNQIGIGSDIVKRSSNLQNELQGGNVASPSQILVTNDGLSYCICVVLISTCRIKYKLP
ncbi:XXYS1_4_G0011690.mRNA.1.CDS.1 [Saccharomyces cerevisiae]|nr:XXYS1_4_G0011690.mRNA.1.CDS.1 [Saccharomyces cerevisiae]